MILFSIIENIQLFCMMNLNQPGKNTSTLYPFPSIDTTSNDGISMRVRAIIQDITGSHNLSSLDARITFDLNRITKAEYIWWIDFLTDDQELWDAYSYADQEYNRLFTEARLYLQGIGK